MNGVKEENVVEFTQSSKGVWYCTKLRIYDEDASVAIGIAEKRMIQIEDVLKKRNEVE